MRNDMLRCLTGGLITAALLYGCATTMSAGTPPRTDRLNSLTVGTSTVQDVLLALGQPRGSGAARSSAVSEPRKILSYEFMEAEGQRIGLKMLLVFILGDRYDGYLWFSSGQLVEEARR